MISSRERRLSCPAGNTSQRRRDPGRAEDEWSGTEDWRGDGSGCSSVGCIYTETSIDSPTPKSTISSSERLMLYDMHVTI
jgi:hypothetical protein